jgi:F1F0 ATPase subunit 2
MNGVPLFIAGATGLGLGLLFFAGLWLTVNRIPLTRHPIFLILASLLLRFAPALAGLLLVLHGYWPNALAYLAGISAARFAVSKAVTRCI